MSATTQIKTLIESLKTDKTEDFWFHLDKVENVLRRAMPLVPFNYPKTSRVHFGWDGRNISRDGLSLPVPSPAELESALERLLEKALGVMALVDGNTAPADVVEAKELDKRSDSSAGATVGGQRAES